MALPWVAVLAVEWLGLRRTFSDELEAPHAPPPPPGPPLPRARIAVLAATLAGFALSAPLGTSPRGPRSRAPSR